LKATLGSAEALWAGIVRAVEESASPLKVEWKASKAAFGRMCLLRHQKRTLLYLTPDKDEVTVAIVLGDRAYGLAMASALPAPVKTRLSESRRYAEGRGIRVSVSSRGDIATIRELVRMKVTPK
jgi:hypothetical protein